MKKCHLIKKICIYVAQNNQRFLCHQCSSYENQRHPRIQHFPQGPIFCGKGHEVIVMKKSSMLNLGGDDDGGGGGGVSNLFCNSEEIN